MVGTVLDIYQAFDPHQIRTQQQSIILSNYLGLFGLREKENAMATSPQTPLIVKGFIEPQLSGQSW